MDEKENLKITLERKWPNNNGPCYSLSIDGEGNVEYTGISNVKTLGKHYSKITQEELNALIDEFKIIYFFSLKDNYRDVTNHSDLQQTSISIRLGNRYKKITHVNGSKVPLSLIMLEKQIEEITNASQWTGIKL